MQTMYRIKDPERSIAFYTGVLGMRWGLTPLTASQVPSKYIILEIANHEIQSNTSI